MKQLFGIFLLLTAHLPAFENLPDSYLVLFGSKNALNKETAYFSFSCPKCVEELQTRLAPIEQDQNTYLVFHPYPQDRLTLMGMVCLEKLSAFEKQIFLQALIAEMEGVTKESIEDYFKVAMDYFGKEAKELSDVKCLKESQVAQDAVDFLKQKPGIPYLPYLVKEGK